MSLNIYYIAAFDFSNGGAAARRVLGNINTLRASGAHVRIIDAKYIQGTQEHNEVPVISVQERPNPKKNIFIKAYKYFSIGRNTIKYIEKQRVKPDFLILYSGYSPYLLRLISYCKKNNIKLVFDCVEWYLPKRKLAYLYNPYYWNIEFAMRYLIPQCDGVICISSFLERYYSKKGVKTINIPPTLTVPTPVNKVHFNTKIKLVYSGSPGHKDKLDSIISIVSELNDLFELDIAGIEGENTSNIHYHGLLTHKASVELVEKSHFSILLRPNNRVSKAGFSTKVVESMSYGTPVITNNTGDLANFIKDGENGYIFDGYDSESLHLKLKSIAINFNELNYNSLSRASQLTAKCSFDSDVYTMKLELFLDAL